MHIRKKSLVKSILPFLYGSTYNRFLKRWIDLIFSFILCLFFLPISLITYIFIRVDSKGPVLADTPDRVGQGGIHFRLLKFRSMIVNAHNLLKKDKRFKKLFEEYKKGSYKLKEDPRVTRVGRIIRKHSIDEVPQFFNVLRGEMSIVGPRAYYPDELENQQEKYPKTRKLVKKVLSVRPGITGLWQVSGRSDINFDKRIAIDAEYIDNMSLWNDLVIMLKTPWAMISGKGAV